MSIIRLALFLCDRPPPEVINVDGTYHHIYNELFRKSLPPSASVNYTLDPYDVRNKMEYPEDVDQYQGIVLTGSAASAYENLEWINQLVAYIASVAEEKPEIKLIGICFGHQIISRALGTDCVPNDGRWELGITTIDLSDIGARLFGVEQLNIQQVHRDHVPQVPPNCELLGSTSITPNQGYIRYKSPGSKSTSPSDIQIFTVQGHPEFTKRIVGTLTDLREGTGIVDKETAALCRQRADWRNDGVDVIGKVIWKILGVEEKSTNTQVF